MNRTHDKGIFEEIYSRFSMPLCEIDCGLKCGPHNDYGVPICCDIHQVIPAAFDVEWSYLEENTTLWTPWKSSGETGQEIAGELQDGQVLLKCKGYKECQRDFRTLTCRAFPFYPYLDSKGVLDGIAYYPEFRFGCWIISNLDQVSPSYKIAFHRTFMEIFDLFPAYQQECLDYCTFEREKTNNNNDQIVLLEFSGEVFLIDPQTEEKYQVQYNELSAYGPYEITRELRFPDE
jgi:hypothetical protein